MVEEAARKLAEAIRESEEYLNYHRLKESVMADAGTAALIAEYHRRQTEAQMRQFSGGEGDAEADARFNAVTGLLMDIPEAREYLIAEMEMRQMLSRLFLMMTEAADVDFPTDL